mmetsp:Transcript_3452/g.13158  ORF Transcript_3452/g.13158 Transcript_3452/m.13158 type:complete len:221 (-) Transcript_3452:155-817(-)
MSRCSCGCQQDGRCRHGSQINIPSPEFWRARSKRRKTSAFPLFDRTIYDWKCLHHSDFFLLLLDCLLLSLPLPRFLFPAFFFEVLKGWSLSFSSLEDFSGAPCFFFLCCCESTPKNRSCFFCNFRSCALFSSCSVSLFLSEGMSPNCFLRSALLFGIIMSSFSSTLNILCGFKLPAKGFLEWVENWRDLCNEWAERPASPLRRLELAMKERDFVLEDRLP